MDLKPIIEEADKQAKKEIEQYKLPSLENLELSNNVGQRLANEYPCNSDIVAMGTRLMDIKLGQAFQEKRLQDHVQMSKEWTVDFLEKHNVPKEIQEKIVNCVEGHHKHVPWICKEAEICANADCYRFLLTDNWLLSLNFYISKMNNPLGDALSRAEAKADEKWDILSIESCKKELEPHYQTIKQIVKLAKP